MANSSWLVLASSGAPAALSCATTVAVLDGRGLGERDLARQARDGQVLAQRVGDLHDVAGRRDAVEAQLADLLDVAEDGRQLGRHLPDLVVGQLQPGQPSDVDYLLAVD